MDTTIAPDKGEDQELGTDAEMPIPADTLAIDGAKPEVGDQVNFKVSGTVSRLVNDMAYVRPETVNDMPMPAPPIKPDPSVNEEDRLKQLSTQYDAQGDY